MSVELPNIEQPISYVVEGGQAVGPMPLRSIADSISTGERPADSLVWWIGSTEWLPFDSCEGLTRLLSATSLETVMPEIPEQVGGKLVDLSDQHQDQDDPIASSRVELDEIKLTHDSVLKSLEARVAALSSATRDSVTSSLLDRAGATPVTRPEHLEELPAIVSESEPSDIRATTLSNTFDGLLRQTVDYERLAEHANRVIELLARACAASLTRHGYGVERNTDFPGHHHLVFTGGVDTRRVRLELTPAPSVAEGGSHFIYVGMAWGRMAFDIDEAVRVVNAELPRTGRAIGVITADAELDTGSVFTRVEMVWPVDDYVADDFTIDHGALEAALDATQHLLEQRWYELFIPAE